MKFLFHLAFHMFHIYKISILCYTHPEHYWTLLLSDHKLIGYNYIDNLLFTNVLAKNELIQ